MNREDWKFSPGARSARDQMIAPLGSMTETRVLGLSKCSLVTIRKLPFLSSSIEYCVSGEPIISLEYEYCVLVQRNANRWTKVLFVPEFQIPTAHGELARHRDDDQSVTGTHI